MRIPSGKTDQYIYFVAVDITDLKTRETGLSGFTVYRSRNGAAAVLYTTPTINETDVTNMPGVYELLVDEDTTIAAGSDSEEYCVHITQASMAPVTRAVELYRRDTTSGTTLDVTATGAAGIDWGNVENKTTANDLTATSIITTQKVDVETIKTNPVANGGTVTFPTNATLASTTNITAGTIATVTTLTNLPAITANWLTAAGINAGALDGKGNWNIGKTGYTLTATTGLGNQTADITGTITTATNVTTVNGLAADVITAAATAADFTTEIQAGLATAAALATVDTVVDAIKVKTDYLPSVTAGAAGGILIAGSNAATTFATLTVTGNMAVGGGFDITGSLTLGVGMEVASGIVVTGGITANITGALSGSVGSVAGAVGSVTGNIGGTLTSTERNAIADAMLNRDMSAVSDTNSRSPLNAFRAIRNKWSISGTTYTVTEEDDATTAWTSTLTTNASGDPISGSDPA